MRSITRTAALLVAGLATAAAQEAAPVVSGGVSLAAVGAGLAAGLAVLGAGLGIGKLAASAMEGIARQPSAAGDIRGAMILTAAFIEGVALFGVVVGLLCLVLK